MAKYIQLTVELPQSDSELAQLALHEGGALGLEVRDSESPPLPGVRPARFGEALLIGSYDSRRKAHAVQRGLEQAFPSARVALEEVADQDWSSSWKSLIRATEVGRLWVGPPWLESQAPPDRVRVVIEPKMAFGTGDHPTTILCLDALDEFLSRHPGATVLDVGCGTAVLAMAARKLGASRVVGVDNDPVSVELARECAAANGVPELELSGASLDTVSGRFDLVLANILANTLVELAPLIAPRVGKRLVMAGVLVPQQDEVVRAYVERGLSLADTRTSGDWIRLELVRS